MSEHYVSSAGEASEGDLVFGREKNANYAKQEARVLEALGKAATAPREAATAPREEVAGGGIYYGDVVMRGDEVVEYTPWAQAPHTPSAQEAPNEPNPVQNVLGADKPQDVRGADKPNKTPVVLEDEADRADRARAHAAAVRKAQEEYAEEQRRRGAGRQRPAGAPLVRGIPSYKKSYADRLRDERYNNNGF